MSAYVCTLPEFGDNNNEKKIARYANVRDAFGGWISQHLLLHDFCLAHFSSDVLYFGVHSFFLLVYLNLVKFYFIYGNQNWVEKTKFQFVLQNRWWLENIYTHEQTQTHSKIAHALIKQINIIYTQACTNIHLHALTLMRIWTKWRSIWMSRGLGLDEVKNKTV